MTGTIKFIFAAVILFVSLTQPLYAAGKTVKIKVTFVSQDMIENNHVGNEWATAAYVNGKKIEEGASVTLTLKATDAVKLKVFAEEQDKIPESGTASMSVKASSVAKAANKTLKATVTENRGRYSGNTATWKYNFKLQKAG